MVAHRFQTSRDDDWLPTLREMELLRQCFELLRKLSETTTYTQKDQLNEIRKRLLQGERKLLGFLEVFYERKKLEEIIGGL